MSTTEDTSAIDEKKAEESGTSTTSPDFKGFISNYLSSIIFTIGISIFVIGGLGLYTTKVAQANILPDDIELAPYTIFDRVVNPISVDMNVMRPSFFSENKDTLSQKAIFNSQEYLDSFNKSFLCSLKNSADPNAGLFANAPLYFSFVYDNLVAKNFLAINTIFFYLSYLPESAIMFLYGLFGIFLWMGLYFFNVCISIFYHIINIPQLFRTTNQETKQWETTESISFFRFMKLILFFFLWIPLGALSAFIMPAFFTIYGLIAPLYASYKLKQTSGKQDKKFNIFDFIKDTFAYKKYFFFILATLSLFSNGIKYLGNNAIVGIIIAVIFAYFMGLYTNEMPESGTDGFSFKIKQNMKQASVNEINLKDPKLVEICQRIPIDDEKLENIIRNIRPRELTKPIEVGGDIDDDTMNIQNTAPIEAKIIPSAPPIVKSLNDNITQSAPPTDTSLEDNITTIPSAPPLQENIAEKIDNLTRQKNNLRGDLANAGQDVGKGSFTRNDYNILEEEINKQINKIDEQIKQLSQNTSQLGGRKQKHTKNNKKYNIRWT